MADDLAAIRALTDKILSAVEALARDARADIRALTRAGRSQAEAIVAADAADAERVAALLRSVEALTGEVRALGTKLDGVALTMKPAADYFAARNAAHGRADGEELDAGKRLDAAGKEFGAAILGNARVQGLAVGIVLALLAGILGLVTGTAGAAQQVYNGSPKQEATDAAHVDE